MSIQIRKSKEKDDRFLRVWYEGQAEFEAKEFRFLANYVRKNFKRCDYLARFLEELSKFSWTYINQNIDTRVLKEDVETLKTLRITLENLIIGLGFCEKNK